MAYKGVDISSHQGDIDITALSSQVDFFIFRGYYGLTKDSKVDRNVQLAIQNNKPYGLYTYSYALNMDRGMDEATRLIDLANSYPVKPNFLVIDMEDADGYKQKNGMPSNDTLIDICKMACGLYERTGYKAVIYASSSWFRNQLAGLNEFEKWVAHWPTKNGKQTGNNTNPDGENANNCAIWQFTSDGKLNGYGGRLDMNYAYKDFVVAGNQPTPQPQPQPTPTPQPVTPDGSTLDLAVGVMQRKYGDGDERKNNLGTRYDEVQDFINHIANASAETLADEVMQRKYGDGDIRKIVLGNRYNEIQDIVNKKSNPTPTKTYIVKSGDTLSGIGAKLGIKWQDIANKNGIKAPYTIYPGQVLKI